MRRRTVLLTIFILAVLAVSAVSLALPEIHVGIPGVPRLDRASTGPLGLKLGLDLQGGAHLVYQADTGTVLTVTFPRRGSGGHTRRGGSPRLCRLPG